VFGITLGTSRRGTLQFAGSIAIDSERFYTVLLVKSAQAYKQQGA
jgi:hypothetical protein